MISVDEAIAIILNDAKPLGTQSVPLNDCTGRIAAEDIRARITQPPFAASAMDGYAVRFGDMKVGAVLSVIGEAPAGTPFEGQLGAGEAVRIFTGGVVPGGADHILIQEDCSRSGDQITINDAQNKPQHIRAAGVDFKTSDVLAQTGDQLHEIHGSIFAAGNVDRVLVWRQPKVAIFSNGDELVEPGTNLQPGQIVNSNAYALCALIRLWGGAAIDLGCASDSQAALRKMYDEAIAADIIVPVGGASVGDHDYAKSVFEAAGGILAFQKVAVRPGKPTWHGRLNGARVIGLPGNPASAIVTAALFVQPLIKRLAGARVSNGFETAQLTKPIAANDRRETFLRATATPSATGLEVAPAANQDSSLLHPFRTANALIRRGIDAPALDSGQMVEIVRFR